MKIKKLKPNDPSFPSVLTEISSPPKQLFILGENIESLWEMPKLAVVGSRKLTPYGQVVTRDLASSAARHGIAIVSGLALGVDGIAHRAALEAKGKTIAVLPCGLDRFYPASHHQLAKQILQQGGALISEYPEGTEPFKTNFIARNRLVSGLGDALLVTEAAEKSGTLHTVNFALEQGKTVLAVPGNITSALSQGTNQLIKTGASPVTEVEDILAVLNIQEEPAQERLLIADSEEEMIILKLLQEGITDGGELVRASGLQAATFNQALTMLEITGRIKPVGAGHWAIA